MQPCPAVSISWAGLFSCAACKRFSNCLSVPSCFPTLASAIGGFRVSSKECGLVRCVKCFSPGRWSLSRSRRSRTSTQASNLEIPSRNRRERLSIVPSCRCESWIWLLATCIRPTRFFYQYPLRHHADNEIQRTAGRRWESRSRDESTPGSVEQFGRNGHRRTSHGPTAAKELAREPGASATLRCDVTEAESSDNNYAAKKRGGLSNAVSMEKYNRASGGVCSP